MGGHTLATGFNNDATGAVSVHLGSALLGEERVVLDTNSFPYWEGISAECAQQIGCHGRRFPFILVLTTLGHSHRCRFGPLTCERVRLSHAC
jgi:hypothetical protein